MCLKRGKGFWEEFKYFIESNNKNNETASTEIILGWRSVDAEIDCSKSLKEFLSLSAEITFGKKMFLRVVQHRIKWQKDGELYSQKY